MWVPGSIAFLVPLAWIGLRLLFGDRSRIDEQRLPPHSSSRRACCRQHAGSPPGDQPRTASTSPRTGLAVDFPPLASCATDVATAAACCWPLIVIYDGLRGPQASPLNLAGVLPWIHWRGLIVLGLLAVGNVSCMACPFTLPRSLAGRWLPQTVSLAAPAAQQVAGRRCWSRCSSGPTRPSLCGTALGGRPGSPSAISWRPLPSMVSFAEPRSANMSARSGSSTSCNRSSRRWK